jgi:hypothetical protein
MVSCAAIVNRRAGRLSIGPQVAFPANLPHIGAFDAAFFRYAAQKTKRTQFQASARTNRASAGFAKRTQFPPKPHKMHGLPASQLPNKGASVGSVRLPWRTMGVMPTHHIPDHT